MSSFGFTTPMATPPRGDARLRPAPPAKTIPFDYVFQFALQGTRGNKVQDVVEISSEGVFVALSVGYSLMPNEQRTEPTFEPDIKQFVLPQTPVMVPFFSDNSPNNLTGVRIIGVPGAQVVVLRLNDPADTDSSVKLPISGPSGIIRPDGTVTIDFEDNPISPDSIIRVWDKTNELLGQVFVVDAPSTPVIGPDPTTGKLPTVGDTSVHVYGWPGTSAATSVTVSLLKNADGTIPVLVRLDENARVEFVLRNRGIKDDDLKAMPQSPESPDRPLPPRYPIRAFAGRIMGRYWYNDSFGGRVRS